MRRAARAERSEETRRRLLDAARRVFLRRGWSGTSLDMVVEEAGLTKGAIYSRFRSKADLFLALLEERIERRIVEMGAVVASEHGSTGLATALNRQHDELRRDGEWSRLAIEFRLYAARMPALSRRYSELHERLRGAMADLVAREAH